MNLTDLPKGEFTAVSEAVFKKIVSEVGSEVFRKTYKKFVHPSNAYIHYYIHKGAINNTTTVQPQDAYLLIIGDVQTGLINVNDTLDNEMGEFIVIGDVVCDYFFNQHGKSTFIDGNLKVNKILNHAVDDSSLIISNDLETAFYYANNGWASVGGNTTMEYGIGYILPLAFADAEKAAVVPKNSEKESAAFLGTTVGEIEDGDFMYLLLEEKIIAYAQD